MPREHVWLQMEASDLLEASVQQIPIMAGLLQLKSLTGPHVAGTRTAFFKRYLLADLGIFII